MARPKPRTRAPWGTMSREMVIDAAERVVRAGRYDELTIRSLAADLNVAPMSIYRHVRDKDDLIEEVVDRLLARRWRPRTKSDDWKVWISEAANRFREFLINQPAALHIYLSHPVTTPSAITRMDAMIDVLVGAGLSKQRALEAYGTINTFTIGFAALASSRARSPKVIESEIGETLASFTTPAQFTEGIRYLLEGIERHKDAR